MKSILLLPFVFALYLCPLMAQKSPDFNCGFDGLRGPDQALRINLFEKQLQQHLARKKAGATAEKSPAAPPYVIPVVVHIIHDGGAENIPDAQILAAVEHLNEAFAAQGYFGEKGATVNTQIQFCMAQRDPEGKLTNGITRTQSPLTNMVMETEDIMTKDLSRWNPMDYVNIWVVKEITSLAQGDGVAGYAYFPTSHGLPQDGMICEAQFFGTSPEEDAVLVHEMGHYFGLYHTFEGGCSNNDCTVDGDRICDTPPDNATHTACPFNSCNTDVAAGSPFVADVDDFTGDFMDYSPFSCFYFFTADQSTRMQGALEITRKSLLQSKACQSPCMQAIVADFSIAPNPALAGQTVVFTNNSSNGTLFSWVENGQEFAQTQNASMSFTGVGFHTIVLNVMNSDPNCIGTDIQTLEIQCPVLVGFTPGQLEAPEGSTIHFTNTSSGAQTYEWYINGQLVSGTSDLDFSFQNSGHYTVILKAIGPFCLDETSVVIKIANACGQLPEPVQTAYTGQRKLFQLRDLVALPDGSIVQCGEHFQQAMVTKWDQAGNLVWHREVPGNGTFTQIDVTPTGQFLLTGEHDQAALLLARLDATGNLLWSKGFAPNAPQVDFLPMKQFDVLAVNPDGTFGMVFRDDSIDGAYLAKFNPNGTVIWSKKLIRVGQSGSLQISRNGQGDFVFVSYNPEGLFVHSYHQNGQLNYVHKYAYGALPLLWIQNFGLTVHSDGGYSIFYTEGNVAFSQNLRRQLIRCNSDGSIRWAKQYDLSNGQQRLGAYIREIPNDQGWMLIDSRKDAANVFLGDFLERLDSSGNVLWTRHLGDTPANDFWVMPPVYQSGRIRSSHCDFFNQDMNLLSIYDSDLAMICAPVVPDSNEVVFVQPDLFSKSFVTINKPVVPVNVPLVISDVLLSSNPVCAIPLPCPEICDNQLDDDEDGYVDCFDTDCACFAQDSACTILPPEKPIGARIAWESAPDLVHQQTNPLVGNLNPEVDSIPEIIMRSNVLTVDSIELLIFKGDGSNRLNPVKFFPKKLSILQEFSPLLIDIDRDGKPELLIPTWDNTISVYTNYQENQNPPFTLWFESGPLGTDWFSILNAADFDQDGTPEIYMGRNVYKFDFSNPAAPNLLNALNGTGQSGAVAFANPGFWDASEAADILSSSDCNGDPDCNGLELACGACIYSIDLDPNDGDGLQIKIQRNLNQMAPGAIYGDGFTQVADMNLDGNPDLVVNGLKNPGNNQVDGCYVWDKNGLINFFPAFISAQWTGSGKLTIANVFNDKKAGFAQDFPEIIRKMGDSLSIVAYNLNAKTLNPAQPFWWEAPCDDVSNLVPITAFDFNRDGLDELVSKGDTFLRVYYGGNTPFPPGVNPATRVLFEVKQDCGTVMDGAIVADVDGDKDAEIVYSFNSAWSYGQLRVLESDNLPWPAARPLWNQYSYFSASINDDLSVPQVQQKHWLEMGGIGSGKRPFNTHLAQVSSLDPFQNNKIKVPDAEIALDSFRCNVDSFEVFLTLCNQGASLLPSGTPITFYLGDPTTTAAPLLFPSILINEALEKGACKNILLKIPATYNANIFAVINDDGSLPRPFTLSANFPVTDQLECHYDNNMVSFSIQNQTPPLDLGPDISLCKNSVIELSANPGFQRYRWQDGSTAPELTAYNAGKYWVDAFDACGFKQTDTIVIQLNTLSNLDLPDAFSVCAGEPVLLSASGFGSYTWSPVDSLDCSNCDAVQVLASKSLTVHLTAATGNCFVSDSVHITIHPLPSIELVPQDGACNQAAMITALVSGNAPFEFLWSDLSTNDTLIASQPGTYTVEIIDNEGCRSMDSASVSINNALTLAAVPLAPFCAQAAGGAIDLSVAGGQAPYQFLWSNAATSEDLSGTMAGAYTVVVTDVLGCSSTASFVLTDPPSFQVAAVKTDPLCAGGSSGLIDLSVTGGTGTLVFAWSDNSSLEDLTQAPAGIYTVLITDANGCTTTVTETLTAPPALALSLQKTDPTCAGNSSGSIDLSASGGVGMLQFEWSNNTSNEDPAGLAAGMYMVVVTDANACTTTLSATLNDPPAITLLGQSKDPLCTNASSGAIDLAASGGTGTLQFLWSNNAVTEDLQLLIAGSYVVTVSDANGCTASQIYSLTDPALLSLSLQTSDPKCAAGADGQLDLNPSGGTGNLEFLWSNQLTQEDLAQVPAGIYSVTVTDANACSAVLSGQLFDPPAMQLSLLGNDLNCPWDTGFIDLTATGGTAGLHFTWSNGATTEDLQIPHSGFYSVSVTDANGCLSVDSILISTLGIAPVLEVQGDTLNCLKTNGLISASADLQNVSFLWSGPNGFTAANAVAPVNLPGIYSMIASDPLGGCTALAQVLVVSDFVTPTLVLATQHLEIPCGQDTSTLSAAGSSGGNSFSIQWSGADGGTILSGANSLFPQIAGSGLYTLQITDLENGCTASATVEVLQSNAPAALVSADSVRCFGENNGVIQVHSISGGTPPYRYSIDHQAFTTDPVFENLPAGLYPVLILDANDCVFSTEIEVGQPTLISVNLSGDSLVIPGAMATVQALVLPSGLTPASIEWTANGTFVANAALELSAQVLQNTLFELKIADANGCSAIDSWLVRVDDTRRMFTPNAIHPEDTGNPNARFVIFTGPTVLEIESLDLFDRWGNQVFSNRNFQPNDEMQGWDGRFRNQWVDPGVFVWVAKVKYKDGKTELFSGDLTVIR